MVTLGTSFESKVRHARNRRGHLPVMHTPAEALFIPFELKPWQGRICGARDRRGPCNWGAQWAFREGPLLFLLRMRCRSCLAAADKG